VTATEIYDPRTGAWSAGAPVPTAYYAAGTAALNGRLYVIGGCDTACGHTDVQVYDPVTNTWSKAASYPEPIGYPSCGAIGGRIYCAGGFTGSDETEDSYAYNPVTNTWSAIAHLPVQLWGGTVGASGGQLLVSGGVTAGDTVLTNAGYAYTAATNTWSALPNAPVAEEDAASACGMYSIGGAVNAASDFVPFYTAQAWQLPGYGDCDGGSSASWLSAESRPVTLSPGQSATLTVTVNPGDPSITQPGSLTGRLAISQDTPYDLAPDDVTLRLAAPASWGEVTGKVTGAGCEGKPSPLSGVTVQVTSSETSDVLATGSDGEYKLWLDQRNDPITVLASDDDWQPQVHIMAVRAGQATTENFALKPDFTCSGTGSLGSGTGSSGTGGTTTGTGSPGTGTHASAASVERLCPAATVPGTAACFAEKLAGVTSVKSSTAKALTGNLYGPGGGYGPGGLTSQYHLPTDGGSGAVIGVVDAYDDPNAESDLAAYRSYFGLPACTTANGCFREADQTGGTSYPQPDLGWAAEISVDLDMVSAIAPQAHIILVEANSNSITDLGAAVNEAVKLGAQYVTNSYGGPESSEETTWDSRYYRHPGVVITAASGDDGYGVTYPAASPDVTAVGGTTVLGGGVEEVWNGTATSLNPGAPGSGCSAYEPKPAWQTDTGCAHRTVTDVSAVADPATGANVYDSYGVPPGDIGAWGIYGGTSVSAPIIAAVYALAGAAGGSANPASYPYGAPSALNNVTTGNNGRCVPAYLCTAGPGYNGPTGLGTPYGVSAFMKPADRGTISGTVTNEATGKPVAGASVTLDGRTLTTSSSGRYTLVVPAGGYQVTISDYLYSGTGQAVTVAGGSKVTSNAALYPVPTVTVSGTVTDGSGQGWPLAATVAVQGTPLTPVHTNPANGRYSVTVPANASYTLDVFSSLGGYGSLTQQVTVGSTGVTQDFQLLQQACAAAGYTTQYAGMPPQTFDASTAPAGWTVTDNIGNGQTWSFSNPGDLANTTGGTGNFAVVNSAYYGTTGRQDTSLVTPVIDLSSVTDPVLSFDTTLDGASAAQTGLDSVFDVDLSLDGGATWSSVWEYTGEQAGSGSVTVPIQQAAGDSDVQVRFHYIAQGYYAPDGAADWEVDDVYVGTQTCAVQPGGLVTGEVLDANTGQPLNGVTVSTAGTTTATGDSVYADLPDGSFEFFAPAGRQQISDSAVGYQPATQTVTVTDGAVTSAATVSLAAGDVTVTPAVSAAVTLGQRATANLTLTNSGGAPATVTLSGQGAQFLSATAGAPAAGGPVRVVKGRYSPARPALGASGLSLSASPSASKSASPSPSSSPSPSASPSPSSSPSPSASPSKSAPASPSASPSRSASASSPSPSATQAAPATGGSSWTSLPDDPDYIAYNGVARTDDGLVYSVGGIDLAGGSETLLTADSFVYASGQWYRIASLPTPVIAPSTAFVNGKLYVIGGIGYDDPLPIVQVYDPATNTWSTGTSMPAGRWAAGTAVVNGVIYVIGGCADAACATTTSTVYAYDPATDGWTQFARYPQDISYLGCGGISGEIYCAGGFEAALNNGTAATYSYSPQTNSWASQASLPAGEYAASSATSDGQLLVAGGITDNAISNQVFAYSPGSNTWSPLPTLPTGEYDGGAACGFDIVGGAEPLPLDTFTQLSGYDQCDGISWLSASSSTVTIPAHSSVTVTLGLNAGASGVTQPGEYTAQLTVGTDTPYQVTPVTVTMNVTPPSTWGQVTGTVNAADCKGNSSALSDATVEVDTSSGNYTLKTDANGQYSLWLPAGDSPLNVIIAENGYLAQAKTVTIAAGKTTTYDVTLKPSGCG
jgi:N-acetylneuraminic acid mutarotase